MAKGPYGDDDRRASEYARDHGDFSNAQCRAFVRGACVAA
jgi:hypothetical protein